MEKRNRYAVWSYWVGIVIVFVTHLYMLGFGMPENQMIGHAVLNLVAGCLLAYSWFGR
jgi:hypothetical protein